MLFTLLKEMDASYEVNLFVFFFLTCEFCVSDCKVEYDPSVMFPGNSVGQRAVLKGH